MIFSVHQSPSSFPTSFCESSHVVFEITPRTNAVSSPVDNAFSSPEQFASSSGSSSQCWWLNENFICGGKTLVLDPQITPTFSQEEEQPFVKRRF